MKANGEEGPVPITMIADFNDVAVDYTDPALWKSSGEGKEPTPPVGSDYEQLRRKRRFSQAVQNWWPYIGLSLSILVNIALAVLLLLR